MTSQTPIGPEQHDLDRRTVRDIVEYSPAQVNEVWCRKIFRRILQSLELQYGMHMPHRAITPDTVVFHDNGEPLLIPSDVPAPPRRDGAAPDPLRDDLTALAGVIHYAITGELIPEGPLHGRGFSGYSDALLSAVDRCMAPDPEQRPRTIDEVRQILGIVQPGLPATQPAPEGLFDDVEPDLPVAPEAPAAPASAPPMAHAAPPAPPAPPMPEPVPAPAAAAAPAPAPASVPLRVTATAPRHDGAPAAAVPAAAPKPVAAAALPVSAVPAKPSATAPSPVPVPPSAHEPFVPRTGTGPSRKQRWAIAAGGGAILAAFALFMFAQLRATGSYDEVALSLPQQGDAAAPAQPQPGTPPVTADASAPGAGTLPDTMPADPAAPGANPGATAPGAANGAAAAPGGATYRLQIQPWGVVYVDGVDRGVSPPVKRLVLAPGRHTVRVTNPNFQDRTLEIDTAGGDGRIVVDFGKDADEAGATAGTAAATAAGQ